MTQKIIQCPFCGSTKLKAFTHSSGGRHKHYISAVHCAKCGCHVPTVKSKTMDYRDYPTESYVGELEEQAFETFAQRADTKTNENEPFKLEGMQ